MWSHFETICCKGQKCLQRKESATLRFLWPRCIIPESHVNCVMNPTNISCGCRHRGPISFLKFIQIFFGKSAFYVPKEITCVFIVRAQCLHKTRCYLCSAKCRINIHKQRGHQMNKHFFLHLLLSFFKMNSR